MILTEVTYKIGDAVWYPAVRKKRGKVKDVWLPATVISNQDSVLTLIKPDGCGVTAAAGVCKHRVQE